MPRAEIFAPSGALIFSLRRQRAVARQQPRLHFFEVQIHMQNVQRCRR